MALTSPGVQVTVIDESFYTPAEPGTTPLIVVATGQNKTNAAGTGTAAGTLKANAGKAYKMTSQKDLVDTFGVPFFEKTASGSPIHGGERNEYGLLAAYSYLSASNAAFIVRADIDLDQLEATADAPGANPTDGAWWLDTQNTTWGVQEWNSSTVPNGGQKFAAKTPMVLSDDDTSKLDGSDVPLASVGSIGDYAVVALSTGPAALYFKTPGNSGAGVTAGSWVLVGSNDWAASWPTVSGGAVTALTAADTFLINGTSVAVQSGAGVSARLTATASYINGLGITGVSAKVANSRLYLYSDGSTDTAGDSTLSGEIVIATGSGTVLTDLGISTGTYLQPKLVHAPHTSVPTFKRTDNPSTKQGYPTGSVWVKTTEPGNGARWRVKKYSSATQAWTAISAPIYGTTHSADYYLDRSNGGLAIDKDSLFVQFNSDEEFSYTTPNGTPATDSTLETSKFKIWRRAVKGATSITSKVIGAGTVSGAKSFTIKQSVVGDAALSSSSTVSFTAAGDSTDAETIAAAINALTFHDSTGLTEITNNVEASVSADNQLVIKHKAGGEIRFKDTSGTAFATLFSASAYVLDLSSEAPGAADGYLATYWQPLTTAGFTASGDAPLNEAEDGQLWFNNVYSDVDIMVHNGSTWKGYMNVFASTDPAGPYVGASMPTTQQDGVTSLVTNDLWISTADMENFPTIYRFNDDILGGITDKWVLVDKTDQVSEEGIVFADARWATSGGDTSVSPTLAASSIVDLLESDFLDFDAPDPALYPKGMLLWNTRRSGGNVKQYRNGYIDVTADNGRMGNVSMEVYVTDRWTTASGNNEDGSGTFGRKAQRKVVVQALKSAIDTSSEIRDEERRNFNLIAAPGYSEVYSNLVNLNIDRGMTAFVLADTPLRLKSNATELINWGTNANAVTDNGDAGVVTYDEYSAMWYPNGFTTDLSGVNAVVPATHMMLKTIALSDQVSYPWFAPAGTRRGGITNATSVGYIDSVSGEFQTVFLNEGMRDVLYDLKINPIPFFVGVGHVAFGQKTRAKNASALDRINVARLVVYLRSQLNKLARPYIFEPNDKITRDEIKGAVESLLLELVGLRALYDFAVVCDESNNTPSRIDRNELYVDIAIEPVKAVEFIYIPLRVKNTGEI
jgi:hypothetical protein